jgi:hypothetical protein
MVSKLVNIYKKTNFMKQYLSEIHRIKSLMNINESLSDLVPKKSDKIFGSIEPTWGGGPNSHASRHPDRSGKDWESNNAYDIMANNGSPIYSLTKGVVQKVNDRPPGLTGKGGKRIYGDSLTVRGTAGDPTIFYTHVTDIVVEEGDYIEKGQLLAFIIKGEMGIPDHVHIGVQTGDVKDLVDVDGKIKNVEIDIIPSIELSKQDSEVAPSILGGVVALSSAAIASLDIKRPESDLRGIATRMGITDTEINVDSVSNVMNKIILSSEGLGTDEAGIHSALKKLKSCSELEQLNKMFERKDVDGKKYKDVFDYINSEMNYGDDLFVQSIVKTLNEICPDSVTNKGIQIVKVKKDGSFSTGIDKVSVNKLLSDLKSYGLSDKAAKGVAANAYGESGFNVKAKGDSGSYAQNSPRSIFIDGKKYCSFGLWQYNVCGGMGVSFLKNYGVDVDDTDDSKKIKVLMDYNKQVEFMAKRIKQEQSNNEKDVETWIDWIVDNVERPSDRFGAKAKRQEFARNQGWT